MLQVNALNQFYGGSHILRNVSFDVPAGKLTTLLGRNGVGKSTLLKCLMGVVPTRSGSIQWAGQATGRAQGRVRAEGTVNSVKRDGRVIESYLGG